METGRTVQRGSTETVVMRLRMLRRSGILLIRPAALSITFSLGLLIILSHRLIASARLLCASAEHDPRDDLQRAYEGGNDVRTGNEFVAEGDTVDGPDGTIDRDGEDQSRHQRDGRASLYHSDQLEEWEEEEAVLVEVERDAWRVGLKESKRVESDMVEVGTRRLCLWSLLTHPPDCPVHLPHHP